MKRLEGGVPFLLHSAGCQAVREEVGPDATVWINTFYHVRGNTFRLYYSFDKIEAVEGIPDDKCDWVNFIWRPGSEQMVEWLQELKAK